MEPLSGQVHAGELAEEGTPDNVRLLRRAAKIATPGERFLPQASALDPEEDLKDMTIPMPLREQFVPRLKEIGYAITDTEEVRDKYGGEVRRSVTVARASGKSLYLLHIPKRILDIPTPTNLGAVGLLESMFSSGSMLSILSSELDWPHDSYHQMMRDWGPKGITAHFVPWRTITDLEKKNYPAIDLARILRLTELLPVGPAAVPAAGGEEAPGRISDEDIDAIAAILGELAATAKPDVFYKNLVDRLDLPAQMASQIQALLSGDALADARSLINWALARGRYRDTHRYAGCAIVGLLIALTSEGAGAGENADFLITILTRHRLLTEEKIERIRQGEDLD